jgi:hypothetical protein
VWQLGNGEQLEGEGLPGAEDLRQFGFLSLKGQTLREHDRICKTSKKELNSTVLLEI